MSDMGRRWDAVMMGNYGTPAVGLVRGEGARVWDEDGKEYVDGMASLWYCAIGHGRAEMADAIDRDGLHVGVGGHRPRARDDDV